MRRSLDLDVMTLDKFNLLLHGDYAAGKTHLLADFLATEREHGPIHFWNLAGEDGYLTMSSFGLGKIGETLETYQDVDEAINEATKTPYHALAIDGLKSLAEMVIVNEVGSDRMPTINRGGGDAGSGKNEWSEVNWAATRLYRRLRHCADIVFATVNSDKNPNPLMDAKKLWIGPDLPGKQARDIGPWDLVGYLRADPLGPGRLRRVITFTPNNEVVVRQRLPKAILTPIILPEGAGGWTVLYNVFKGALKVGE
jgi:hypothetical protein